MKRFWAFLFLIAIFTALSSCAGTRTLMMTAPKIAKPLPAQPILAPKSQAQWESSGRAKTLALLEHHVYGARPASAQSQRSGHRRTISEAAFNGAAKVEEQSITLSVNGVARDFNLVLVTPIRAQGPVPIIIMQNFCPNHDVIPVEGITAPKGDYMSCSSDAAMAKLFSYFFGRYITTPPIETIMERGYALAVMHPPEFAPDNARAALPLLAAMSDGASDQRWGAVSAWAWQAAEVANLLAQDARYSAIASHGHSRYGKSALLAASYSQNIDAVIAHQSGTGGASLSKDKPGETVEAITQNYPHWFTPQYSAYSANQSTLPIDQHHLLALLAPRPILLGNARRDVWSDPEGAFRAALGANPVYALYGSDGLTAQSLTQFRPSDDIAFWIRGGTHGVVKEDWPAFLEFLDAHFKP